MILSKINNPVSQSEQRLDSVEGLDWDVTAWGWSHLKPVHMCVCVCVCAQCRPSFLICHHHSPWSFYLYIKRAVSAARHPYINLNASLDFRPWRGHLIPKIFEEESLILGIKYVLFNIICLNKLLNCVWTFFLWRSALCFSFFSITAHAYYQEA